MSIVPLSDLLADAGRGGYAVGYFESWDVYSFEATLAAAEAERSPVIIGIGGLSTNHEWLRTRGIELYGRTAEALARRSSVPTAVLFNEADSFAEAAGALGAGYNAVMMHTQGWPWERLASDTAALVAAAHALDIAVEGEVGALAEMRDGRLDDDEAQMTTVEQARDFVKATGVDCLAVAVGNVHFVTAEHDPQIDQQRIRDIDDSVDVPLVLHGGSGTPPEQMREAIAAGITKVNFGTRLKHVFGNALEAALRDATSDPNLAYGSRDPGDVCLAGADALRQEIRRLIQILGSNERA
jgi:ketose-bisphosphate aldolase